MGMGQLKKKVHQLFHYQRFSAALVHCSGGAKPRHDCYVLNLTSWRVCICPICAWLWSWFQFWWWLWACPGLESLMKAYGSTGVAAGLAIVPVAAQVDLES